MIEMTPLIDRYFALWNETDPGRRRDLIAQTFTEDASYLSPLFDGEGHNGIELLAQGIQDRLAGYQFLRTSEIDAHHDHLRFTWEVIPRGSAAVRGGSELRRGGRRRPPAYGDEIP